MMTEDEKPRQLPERFRASTDPNDPGYALLQANDARQAELKGRLNSPFAQKTSQDIQQQKAIIGIQSLLNPALVLNDDQNERLAEYFATLGEFDEAIKFSLTRKDQYARYKQAIERDDAENCDHPDDLHAYVKDYIYSKKHGKTMALVACNVCRDWNVKDIPDVLKQRIQSEKR